MAKKNALKKAKVYIWPMLDDSWAEEIEAQCIDAGYQDKRRVRVGRVVCWEVS